MKKEVRKISTLTLFNLDPEVLFHTNDVTLNSSIVIEIETVFSLEGQLPTSGAPLHWLSKSLS
jgi:glycerol kinase